jgi:hypothetical protein
MAGSSDLISGSKVERFVWQVSRTQRVDRPPERNERNAGIWLLQCPCLCCGREPGAELDESVEPAPKLPWPAPTVSTEPDLD